MNIYQKLIEVRKSVPYLQKESKGFQFNYVGSSQVLGTLKAKMDELGLLLIPSVISKEIGVHETAKGAKEYFTELVMEFTWVNADEPTEKITSKWYGQGLDSGEKGVGKAVTYAEKYFMLKFFNIPTDKDDPDSFQSKHEEKAGKPEPQRQAQKPVTQKPVEQKPADPNPINWPAFWANIKKQGYTEAQVHKVSGVESIATWNRDQVNELMEKLKTMKSEAK